MSRVLECRACERVVEKFAGEEFDYEVDGAGPYCETCWIFVGKIEALEERVARLENTKADRHHKPQSPYNASRKRASTCSCGCGYRYISGECRNS